jgi:hypothetical protein
MIERETPIALRGLSVDTVRQRFGARWPAPVQRWLKDATVAEVAIWLAATNGDDVDRTYREQGTLRDQG